MRDRSQHPFALAATLVLLTAGIVALLIDAESSGTGAVNVGEREREIDAGAAVSRRPRRPPGRATARRPRATRAATTTTSPTRPRVDSLGDGFIITGKVRAARGCAPLEGVRVQVWLATETGGEQDNRATRAHERRRPLPHRDGADDPAVRRAQHPRRLRRRRVSEPVFIRRVVDLDDDRAVVDLTLAR